MSRACLFFTHAKNFIFFHGVILRKKGKHKSKAVNEEPQHIFGKIVINITDILGGPKYLST